MESSVMQLTITRNHPSFKYLQACCKSHRNSELLQETDMHSEGWRKWRSTKCVKIKTIARWKSSFSQKLCTRGVKVRSSNQGRENYDVLGQLSRSDCTYQWGILIVQLSTIADGSLITFESPHITVSVPLSQPLPHEPLTINNQKSHAWVTGSTQVSSHQNHQPRKHNMVTSFNLSPVTEWKFYC